MYLVPLMVRPPESLCQWPSYFPMIRFVYKSDSLGKVCQALNASVCIKAAAVFTLLPSYLVLHIYGVVQRVFNLKHFQRTVKSEDM